MVERPDITKQGLQERVDTPRTKEPVIVVPPNAAALEQPTQNQARQEGGERQAVIERLLIMMRGLPPATANDGFEEWRRNLDAINRADLETRSLEGLRRDEKWWRDFINSEIEGGMDNYLSLQGTTFGPEEAVRISGVMEDKKEEEGTGVEPVPQETEEERKAVMERMFEVLESFKEQKLYSQYKALKKEYADLNEKYTVEPQKEEKDILFHKLLKAKGEYLKLEEELDKNSDERRKRKEVARLSASYNTAPSTVAPAAIPPPVHTPIYPPIETPTIRTTAPAPETPAATIEYLTIDENVELKSLLKGSVATTPEIIAALTTEERQRAKELVKKELGFQERYGTWDVLKYNFKRALEMIEDEERKSASPAMDMDAWTRAFRENPPPIPPPPAYGNSFGAPTERLDARRDREENFETIPISIAEIKEEIERNIKPVLEEKGAQLEQPVKITPEQGGEKLKIEIHILKSVWLLGDYRLSVDALIGNDQDFLRLENHQYGGDQTAINEASGAIDSKINQLMPTLIAFIENKHSKKLKSLKIVSGQLEAKFINEETESLPPPAVQVITPLRKEPPFWVTPKDTPTTTFPDRTIEPPPITDFLSWSARRSDTPTGTSPGEHGPGPMRYDGFDYDELDENIERIDNVMEDLRDRTEQTSNINPKEIKSALDLVEEELKKATGWRNWGKRIELKRQKRKIEKLMESLGEKRKPLAIPHTNPSEPVPPPMIAAEVAPKSIEQIDAQLKRARDGYARNIVRYKWEEFNELSPTTRWLRKNPRFDESLEKIFDRKLPIEWINILSAAEADYNKAKKAKIDSGSLDKTQLASFESDEHVAVRAIMRDEFLSYIGDPEDQEKIRNDFRGYGL